MYIITLTGTKGNVIATTTADSQYEASISAHKLRFSVSRASVRIATRRSS